MVKNAARPVRIRDVAELAGVSVGTVSNVLNRPESVTSANLEKVRRAMDDLGFVRNDVARQLRQGVNPTFGLVAMSLMNPFFGGVAHAAQQVAEEFDHTVVVGSSDQDHAREDRYVDLFEQQRVRGLMIAPIAGASARLEAMRSHGTPVVLLGSTTDDRYSSVQLDGVAAGYVAVQHLVESGRRHIAFAGGPLHQVVDRLTGASRAVRDLPGAWLTVMETADLSLSEGRRLGERLVAMAAADRPEAVFAANDLLAVGILQALLAGAELRVPDDIALVGYDDIDFASSATVPLTSIVQPTEQIAREAIRMLLAESSDPTGYRREHVLLPPELVARASSSPRG
ncbi:MAG: LacI family DNA-binding transcriptional regulator [Propionicimonas sp.]